MREFRALRASVYSELLGDSQSEEIDVTVAKVLAYWV